MLGRSLSGRAVGSTSQLKGLETGVADTLQHDEMNAKNLHVVMIHRAKKLLIALKLLPFSSLDNQKFGNAG